MITEVVKTFTTGILDLIFILKTSIIVSQNLEVKVR